jgi:hypothetical protein
MNTNGHAKIELGSLRIVKNHLPDADLRRAMTIAKDHNDEFERKWDEFFNR